MERGTKIRYSKTLVVKAAQYETIRLSAEYADDTDGSYNDTQNAYMVARGHVHKVLQEDLLRLKGWSREDVRAATEHVDLNIISFTESQRVLELRNEMHELFKKYGILDT